MASRFWRFVAVSVLLLPALVSTAGGAAADPGDMDPSFGGGDGQVATKFADGPSLGNGEALQPDGKLLVAGVVTRSTNDSVFALVRYKANGTIDTSFGKNGRVETDFTAGADVARDVFVADDGTIVAAGTANDRMGVARYHPDGTLDHSFSTDGKATVNVGGGVDIAYDAAPSKGGRIVLAGVAFPPVGEGVLAVARLNHDGTPDHDFSGDGKVTIDLGDGSQALAVLVGSGGAIVASGQANGAHKEVAAVRFLPSGGLDPNFGDGGSYVTDVGQDIFVRDFVRLPSGKFLVAGCLGSDPASFDVGLVRLNANGKPDGSFGPTGLATAHFEAGPFNVVAIGRAELGFVVSGDIGAGPTTTPPWPGSRGTVRSTRRSATRDWSWSPRRPRPRRTSWCAATAGSWPPARSMGSRTPGSPPSSSSRTSEVFRTDSAVPIDRERRCRYVAGAIPYHTDRIRDSS